VLYRNEKSSRESDTCGSTGFIENKQRERRDRTEMDQAAGATDQLLLESKSHGTKNARREREVTATNSKEKGHARPWQAALARTMKTTTGHGELFPVEWTSRPPGPHGQALLGLDSHKSRSAPAAGRERWLWRRAARRRAGLQRCGCEGRGQELHCHGQHRTGAPTWRPSTKNRTLRTARGASEKSKQSRPKLHDLDQIITWINPNSKLW